jgi:ribosomal protein L23
MYKKFIFLNLILLSFNSRSENNLPWKDFSNQNCGVELNQFTQKLQLETKNIHEVIADSHSQRAFRASTNIIGLFFEFHFNNQSLEKIVKIENEKLYVSKISPKNCSIAFTEEKFPYYLTTAFKENRENDFNDKNLSELIQTTNTGLIYFWSPRFSYSVEYLPEIFKISKKLNLNLTIVADPRATNLEIDQSINKVFNLKADKIMRSIASTQNIKIMKSYDLFLRNGFNHFPVMYYYSNKKIHPSWITGLMTYGGIKEMTHAFQKDLK